MEKAKEPCFQNKIINLRQAGTKTIKTHYKLLMHSEIFTVTMIPNNFSSMDHR